MNFTFEDLIPIILAIIAAGPGIVALLGQKRKDKRDDAIASIDNAGKVTQQALTLIQPLNVRIQELEDEMKEVREESKNRDKIIAEQNQKIGQQDKTIREQSIRLNKNEDQIKKLKIGIRCLIDQIIRLGHIPDWQPDFIEGE